VRNEIEAVKGIIGELLDINVNVDYIGIKNRVRINSPGDDHETERARVL